MTRECKIPRAVLERALQAGASYRDIARDHGWTVATISRRCRDLGLRSAAVPCKKIDDEELRLLLLNTSLSSKEIGLLFGCSGPAVVKRARRLGLPTREGRPPRRRYNKKIVDAEMTRLLLRTTLSQREIGALFGCTGGAVSVRARELGLPTCPGARARAQESLHAHC